MIVYAIDSKKEKNVKGYDLKQMDHDCHNDPDDGCSCGLIDDMEDYPCPHCGDVECDGQEFYCKDCGQTHCYNDKECMALNPPTSLDYGTEDTIMIQSWNNITNNDSNKESDTTTTESEDSNEKWTLLKLQQANETKSAGMPCVRCNKKLMTVGNSKPFCGKCEIELEKRR